MAREDLMPRNLFRNLSKNVVFILENSGKELEVIKVLKLIEKLEKQCFLLAFRHNV